VSRFARVSLLILGIAVAVAVYLWWSSPERQIRRVLDAVSEGLSHDGPATGLSAISTASALQSYFTPDVTVVPGTPFEPVKGRDSVIAAAARLLSATAGFRVEFVDVQINLASDSRSAGVDCTAVATLRDRAGQETVDAREIVIDMNVVEGRWVIADARAVDVLEPVAP
jgi:hypothetical protein